MSIYRGKTVFVIGGVAISIIVAALVWLAFQAGRSSGSKPVAVASSNSSQKSGLSDRDGYRGTQRRVEDENVKKKGVNAISFSPAEFELDWAKAMKGANERDRMGSLMLLVSQMASQGQSLVTVERIMSDFGPGSTRNSLIGIVFTRTLQKEQLNDVYKLLEFDDEKRSARQGLSFNIANDYFLNRRPFELPENYLNLPAKEEHEVQLDSALRYLASNAGRTAEEVSNAFESVATQDFPDALKIPIYAKAASIVPFDCWNRLKSDGLQLSEADMFGLSSSMVARDPVAAIEILAGESKTPDYLAVGVDTWLKRDAVKSGRANFFL